MIKFALLCVAALSVCSGATLFCHAAEFLDELVALEGTNDANAVPALGTESGYDSMKDVFYFQDDAVAKAFTRDKFFDTIITMAGQRPDLTGSKRPPALHPFAVAQKSLLKQGVSSDRWDVKENHNGVQYLAAYHGQKSDFVVNKVRAHLLRRVADATKDYLPILDHTAERNSADKQDYTDKVKEEVRNMIVSTVQDVDNDIRGAMKNNDDSAASATVAIITRYYVIVANVGSGRVIAYDSTTSVTDLSASQHAFDNKNNLFGMRKSRSGNLRPFVEIFSRYFTEPDGDDEDEDEDQHELQFLLLETPVLAALMSEKEVVKIVLNEIKLHKAKPEGEQELFTNSVTNIMKSVADKVSLFKLIPNRDQLVMMVALQTDYKQIH